MTPDDIYTDLLDRFDEIPFENSQFQDEAFVIAAQHTPARAYRAIGLRMFAKLEAIRELKYKRALDDLRIEELDEIIADPDMPERKRRKAELRKSHILSGRPYQDKLLRDALAELDFLYRQLQRFPRYTREQFEREEPAHFRKRLAEQIETARLGQASGAAQSLLAMDRAGQIDQLIHESKQLLGITDETTEPAAE